MLVSINVRSLSNKMLYIGFCPIEISYDDIIADFIKSLGSAQKVVFIYSIQFFLPQT